MLAESPGLCSTPKRLSFGKVSLRISMRFALISGIMSVIPLALVPGRGKLWTKPEATASPTTAKTIGSDIVAFCAAVTFAVPGAQIGSTLVRPCP